MSRELVVPNAALASRLAVENRAGAIVFAAAKGRQQSFEPSTARKLTIVPREQKAVKLDGPTPHGFFTGALLAALTAPETDADGNGTIEISELIDEVTARVTSASQGKQTPWVARRDLFGDFAISLAIRPH